MICRIWLLIASMTMLLLGGCTDQVLANMTDLGYPTGAIELSSLTGTAAPTYLATPTPVYDDYAGLGGYPLVTVEDVGDISAGSRVRAYGIFFDGTSTVYQIMAQDEVTTAEAREDQLMWAPDVTPGLTPTVPLFGDYIGMGYLLVTTEQVGAIPAGARVKITHVIPQYNGYMYGIMAEDEVTTAEAREAQLALAPGVTPGPTPVALFNAYIGMGYSLVTTEQVGGIAAGTRVRISHGIHHYTGWLYGIVAEDGVTTAEAREDQLALAPDATPGSTPTASPIYFATPTSAYDDYLGMGGYPLMTIEDVGDIPAGSRVRTYGISFDGTSTIYQIMAQDEVTTAEAREDQLMWAPDVTPGTTPANPYSLFIGRGYLLITTEQVGDIPAGVRVRITHGIPQYNGCLYGIVAEDEVTTAEAREYQLMLAPDVTPGPTPTAMFAGYMDEGYPLVTTEQVGDIPEGTRVRIVSWYINYTGYVYTIVAEDEATTAEAHEAQLALAP